MEGRFHRFNDPRVHHLQGSRNNARTDDIADRLGRRIDRFEDAQHRSIRGWIASQPHPRLGADAERSFTPYEQARHVEPGRILSGATERHYGAVRHHRFDTQDMIDGHAVFQSMRAARVGGDVAADSTRPLTRWIGGIVVASPLQSLGQMHVDEARFNHREAVAHVDFQDLLHSRQSQHHSTADRQTAASQTGAGTAGDEGKLQFIAELDDTDDLLGGRGEHDYVGHLLFDRVAIALVDE